MYVRGNPLSLTEPSGNDPCPTGGNGCGGVKQGDYNGNGIVEPGVDQIGQAAVLAITRGRERQRLIQTSETYGFDEPIDFIVHKMNANDNWMSEIPGLSDANLGIKSFPGREWDFNESISDKWGRRQRITLADGSEWDVNFDLWTNIHYGYLANESRTFLTNGRWERCADD
jgi:hypothetical protein